MQLKNFTAIVNTRSLEALKTFYTSYLGFRVSFEHESYLGLQAGDIALGFMKPCSGEQLEFEGKGLTYGFVVEDVDQEYAKLSAAGVKFMEPPSDRPWGDRAAIAMDPIGTAIYLRHPIKPKPEYQQCVKE